MTSERKWDWVDWLARRLIIYAARRTPDSLSARLEEEWSADSAAQVGAIPRLCFAFGCCWAASAIAHEHAQPAIAAAGPPAGHFIRFPQDEYPFLTSGMVAFVPIVSLFAALLYGLAMVLTIGP